MKTPILYSIFPSSPEAHLFEVRCTVSDPDPAGQKFSLPTWIPGSYLIREFAKNVVRIRAQSGRKQVPLVKLDKNTWQVAPTEGPVTVTMEVYAWDLSVRGAHLDTTHAFFNGPSVFPKVQGRESDPCEVEILPPKGARYRNWRIATAMSRKGAKPYGFGTYQAINYDELIDHPVEIGTFTLATFKACGVPHDIAITGRHRADMNRLCRDLKTLCETQIRFFGEPAPMERYVFLVTAVGEGYGGLEHRASTALLCSRDELPQKGVEEVTNSYRTFLGLCSHEYFHTWNVKRIKPAAFAPYDLDIENYTTLLWAFEGITSYYDDVFLVRSGLISRDAYLESVAKSITSVLRGSGRKKQTVAESSFDAWIKYYRQDENAPNAVVSYYVKGGLVALCLDLLVREQTGGRKSLDHVMRALWKRHGLKGIGVEEDGIERLAEEVTGLKLKRFFDQALRTTSDLPLEKLLTGVGVDMELRRPESSADKGGKRSTKPATALTRLADLGVRTTDSCGDLKVTHVLDGGAAQKAGLAAGDTIIALDELRVTPKNFDGRLGSFRPGETVQVHAFRRDELLVLNMTLAAPPAHTCVLSVSSDRTATTFRRRWLGKA
ncbi:MAG TPA: M61 family metallopeptidase [Burkholderiales bacterium]|nr:M61 family metallopeptidase [Burkholderiales bacterium]